MTLRRCRTLLIALAAAAAMPLQAAPGFYVSTGLGLNLAPGITLGTGDNDRPSRCDGFVNPSYALLRGCTDPDRSIDAVDQWTSTFGEARGPLAGAALGYRVSPRLRFEIEYGFRHATYDERSDIIAPGGAPYVALFGPELPRAEERVGDVAAHDALASVLVDFPTGSRVTPYVGVGVGGAWLRIDYTSYWARAIDPATVETAAGLPNEAEVRGNLAGTVTLAQTTLRDRAFAYRFTGGVAFALADRLTLDVSLRLTRVGRLEDGDSYVLLRSHVSNLRVDGSEPVEYRAGTEDTGNTALVVGLRRTF